MSLRVALSPQHLGRHLVQLQDDWFCGQILQGNHQAGGGGGARLMPDMPDYLRDPGDIKLCPQHQEAVKTPLGHQNFGLSSCGGGRSQPKVLHVAQLGPQPIHACLASLD